MGEVYRARDVRLGRDVAVKILPSGVAPDRDRLSRFEREAQVLASLNHPNVAAIHGVEDSTGISALVMEFVDGATLAERIARGPIPLDEALPIARQIAEALEAAHECGIVHRDLKPANIKVRPDGVVKVLDFGLAKALDRTPGETTAATMSPTLSIHATRVGILLGTAAYMSPEQTRSNNVDRRADIWAFGAVLFEMLSGQRVFPGDDISDIVASILKTEPDWHMLPSDTPPYLRRLIDRCLVKDPKQRLRDIGEARIAIDRREEALVGPGSPVSVLPSVIATTVGVLAVAAGVALGVQRRSQIQPAATLVTTMDAAGVEFLPGPSGPDMVLSPDGRSVAFVGRAGTGVPQLFVRRLDRMVATPLSGTQDPVEPFFSPDGQWIAFVADGTLKKVPLAGGPVVTICDGPAPRGATWSDDGTIIISPDTLQVPNAPLERVSENGGPLTTLISLSAGEATHRWPQALPHGRGILFTSSRSIGAFDDANLEVVVPSSGVRKVILRGGYHGRYVPSGHLLYIREGKLLATAFDLDRLEVVGGPHVVVDRVFSNSLSGGAQFSVSDTGLLTYVPGPTASGIGPIHWVDRQGTIRPLRSKVANWSNIRFSPDGGRLALEILDGQNDIWVYEWARDSLTRVTSDPASDETPVWTPDGRRIVFASTRGGGSPNLYWQAADGSDDAQRLTTSRNEQRPGSWHPTGTALAFEEYSQSTHTDIMVLSFQRDGAGNWKAGTPAPFLNTTFSERDPSFSPDGRWLAYASDETGKDEVYVQSFPRGAGKWQISTNGGNFPTWSVRTHELFYNALDRQVMVVPFSDEQGSFRAESARAWPGAISEPRGQWRMFDVHPDGQRVALRLPTPPRDPVRERPIVVTNFFDELNRLAAR